MELFLESGAFRKRWEPSYADEVVKVHGHTANVQRSQRKRGVFNPKTISYVEVTYNCEQSDRFMKLELSGRCPPEGFDEMLALLSGWWCH
jgi:hypothetical protein